MKDRKEEVLSLEACEPAMEICFHEHRHLAQALKQELLQTRMETAGAAAIFLGVVCEGAATDTKEAVEQLRLAKQNMPPILAPLVAAVETYIHEIAGPAAGTKRK